MHTINPADLRKYINRKIYKYDTFYIEPIELDDVVGEVEYLNTVIYGIKINDVNEIVNFDIDGILLFETLEEAKKKQALDVHAICTGRYKINGPHVKSAVEYYTSLIDKNDLDFFVLTTTNYQMQEEEYRKILTEIIEKNPEYLI